MMHQHINPRLGIRSARVYRFDGLAILEATPDLIEVENDWNRPIAAGKGILAVWRKNDKGEWGWHVIGSGADHLAPHWDARPARCTGPHAAAGDARPE